MVKPSALGDVIHSLPFLKVMKERYPDAQIHWVIARSFQSLLEGHPMIHRLWVFDKDAWKQSGGRLSRTISDLRRLFRALKAERFDLVVDLQGLLRSGIISLAAGCPVRVGFAEAREGSRFFYSHLVEGFAGDPDIHAVDRYLRVAEYLGCKVGRVEFPLPALELDAEKRRCLRVPERYAVLAPAAGGTAKKWPPRRFGELAARLPLPSVVVAGGSDAALADEVVSFSAGKAISVAGQTSLLELAAITKGADFVVCNDTGPMHLAVALNVPVFALFGPTNPLRTGPYGPGHTVIREKLSCSPCYRRKACPNLKCMESLTVERVHSIIAAASARSAENAPTAVS